MNIISKFLNKVTMYQSVLYGLRIIIGAAVIFSFIGWIDLVWWEILGSMVLFLVFSWASNLLLTKILGLTPNFESQYITAEILTIIVGPLNPITQWWVILFVAFMAMASKYVLVYNKRHIFNPAAAGVVISTLLIGQDASWWVGNPYLMPVVLVCGLLILQKLRWFHVAAAFAGSYIISTAIVLMSQGYGLSLVYSALQSAVVYSSIIFFVTFMLIEPLTAPRSKNWRIIYGIVIAALMVFIPQLFPKLGNTMEIALLLGNLGAFLLTVQHGRYTLTLTRTLTEAKDTVSFFFKPSQAIKFTAGQYMEWTLPHDKPDNRGLRRYFTIASSPTQSEIQLVTKTTLKPSTFKQALFAMKAGGQLTLTSQEGEFTLPKPTNGKITQPMIWVAGGVGITPFLSMAQWLIDTKTQADVVMYYANKTADEIGFTKLSEQAKMVGVRTLPIIAESPPTNWRGHTGFLTPEIVKQDVPDYLNRKVYISGPEGMVQAYLKMFKGMGVPNSQIKRDYFPGY